MPPYKIPPNVREMIFKKLLTSPERKLMYDASKEELEAILADPNVRRAWLHGSFTTSKPDPSDIDVVLQGKWRRDLSEPLRTQVSESAQQRVLNIADEADLAASDLHVGVVDSSPYSEKGKRFFRDLVKKGREKYGSDYKITRILGLAGALGLGGQAMNGEAEAGQASNLLKQIGQQVQRVTKGIQSSAATNLIGQELPERGVIKNVVKGKGDWRYIQFEDGTELPVSRDVIHDLSRHYGTTKYMTQLGVGDKQAQLEQAKRSLVYHERRQDMFHTKTSKEDWLKQHQDALKQLGLEPEPYVWVPSKKCYMPKKYVDILEEAGELRK